jgi:hypothetical protein
MPVKAASAGLSPPLLSNYPKRRRFDLSAGRITVDAREKD